MSNKITLLSIKTLILFLISFSVYAVDADISWIAPTERADNSPLLSSEIKGYTIFCYEKEALVLNQAIGNVTETTIVLPYGTYYCNMNTIDTSDISSDRSNSIKLMLHLPKPKPPVLQ